MPPPPDDVTPGPTPPKKSIQEEFNDRFAAAAHGMMRGNFGRPGLVPEGEPPPIDTSIPVVEPAHLAQTPVTAKRIATSPTTLNTAGKTPASREETMNAEKAFQGQWDLSRFDFSEKPVLEPLKPEVSGMLTTKFSDTRPPPETLTSSTTNPILASHYRSRMDNIGARRMIGLANEEDLKDLAYYTTQYQKYSGGKANFVGEVLGSALPLGEQLLAGGALSVATRGVVKPQWGAALAAGMEAGGATFNRLKTMRTADGTPVSDGSARGAALIVTAVQGAAFLGGEEVVRAGLGPLVAKLGGGKTANAAIQKMVEWAATNPSWAARLTRLAGNRLNTATAIKAYGLLGEIAEAFGQNVVATGERAAGVPDEKALPLYSEVELRQNLLHTAVDPKETALQFGLATLLSPFARPWKQAHDNVKAQEAQERTLPALEQLAQGEAGKAPDHLAETVTDMQETHDPDGPTQNVEIAAQKVRDLQQENGGQPLHPALEERVRRGEKGGGNVVIPTGDHTAYVLTQKGSKKLEPFTSFGEVPSASEAAEGAELLKKAREPNPIEDATEKVANDIKTKFSGEMTPEETDRAAEILSSFVRTTSIDRARSLGIEPTPFEDYARTGPLEPIGGREKSLQTFSSGLERLASTVAREKRLAGTAEAKEPKSELERVQDLARKSFGETFIAFEAGGQKYLSAEAALATGEKVTPTYVRPEDIKSATKDTITTNELGPERQLDMAAGEIKKQFTEEGRKFSVEEQEQIHGQKLKGFAQQNRGFISMMLTGHADSSTFFHEMGHFIHYYLEKFDPARFKQLFGENPTMDSYERFAENLERYFKEGKAPNAGQVELYQYISRLMRSSGVDNLVLPAETTNSIHRLFALQEEVEPAVRVLAPGLEHGILEPKAHLEREQLVKDYETKTLENVSEAAGAFERKNARDEFQKYRNDAEEAVVRSDLNNAVNWLQEGRTLDGRNVNLEHGKLDAVATKQLGYAPSELPRGVTAKEGYDPGIIASEFGLDTKDFLDGLMDWEPLEDQARNQAEQRFSVENPGWSASDDWVKARGREAAVNAALKKIHAFDLKTLGKAIGFKGDEAKALLLGIENEVRESLRNATARDLKPGAYYRAMIRQTQTMVKEWGSGNFREAHEAAAQAARAREFFSQVSEMKTDTDRRVKRAADLATNEAIQAKVNLGGKEYQAILNWTLQALGFEPHNTVTPEQVAEAVRTLQEREEAFPLPTGFESGWGLDGQRGAWKSLSSDVLHDALDVADRAVHLGRDANTLRIAGDKANRELYVKDLVNQLRPVAEKKGLLEGVFKPPTGGLTSAEKREFHPGKRARLKLNDMSLDLTKSEGEVQIIDGETAGPLHQAVIQPVFDGTFRVEKLMKTENDAYKERWGKPRNESMSEQRERFFTNTELPNEKRTPIKIYDVVKNVVGMLGDRGVRDRFLRGHELEYGKVISWLNELAEKGLIKPEDIDRYHEDRAQLDSHFNRAADIKEKETGIRPEKVPASPFFINFPDGSIHGSPKLVEGGYWGFEYDFTDAPDARKSLRDPTDPSTQRLGGKLDDHMVQQRTATGRLLPLKLESDVVPRALESVVRFNELQETLNNTQKILNTPEMKDFLNENYRGAYRLLMDWQSVVGSRGLLVDSRGPQAVNRMVRWTHAGSNNFLLAARMSGSFHIMGSVFQGMHDAGLWNGVKGATKVMFSVFTPGMENEFKRIESVSDEVHSLTHLYEEASAIHINEQVEAMNNPGVSPRLWNAYKNGFKQFSTVWFKAITRIAQTMTYAGAEYRADEINMREGRELGSPAAEAFKKNFSEAAVRNSHGASGTKDTARFFRERWGFAFFNPVSSYRNSLYQHVREMGYELGRGEYGRAFGNMMYNFMLPGAWSAIVRGAWPTLLGIGVYKALSNEDRAKYALNMLIHSTVTQFTGGFPIIGDVVNKGLSLFDPALHKHLGGEEKESITNFFGEPLSVPMMRPAERLYNDIKKWEKNGEPEWDKMVPDLAELGGTVPYSPSRGISTGMAWVNRYWAGQNTDFNDVELWKDFFSPTKTKEKK